jgi:drug/metabolite transporter (DMT)-like permease
MVAGGSLLVLQGWSAATSFGYGAIAVVAATFAWAADNVLGRPLADRDAAQVVAVKGALGVSFSVLLAVLFKDQWPKILPAVGLLSCGAVGYGASLRLYLRAQRLIGSARTGSIFAAAPFLGAAIAWALGEGAASAWTAFAGGLCAVGVGLHLTEGHHHSHEHGAMEHEHSHRHDDGHHDHHDHVQPGEHSHRHRHEAVAHTHSHAADLHHRHDH